MKHTDDEGRMKRTIIKTSLLLTLMALGACTLVWGRSFNVVEETPDRIKIEFYRATVNEPRMNEAAANYCAKYLKNAVLEDVSGNDEFTNTYRCVAPTGFRPVIMDQPETLN